MSNAITFDPRWSMPTAEAFIREYMAQQGCDIPNNWDALGEIAVLAYRSNDEKVKLQALKEVVAYTKIAPRTQDALGQPVGGIKPLVVGLADDVLIDAEYEEIENEADAEYAEFSENPDDIAE